MEGLYEQFAIKLRNIKFDHKRYLFDVIDWSRKLLIVKGTRRVGKTTLALQYVKQNFKLDNTVLYVSADNIYFSGHNLFDLAQDFTAQGGICLIIDEIHKYSEWESEIENVLNNFEKLQLVLIGSSVADYSGNTHISETAAEYELQGLSFREFILFSTGIRFDKLSLEDLMSNHVELSMEITQQIDPLMLMNAYLRYGYYPFFLEDRTKASEQIAETLGHILENDLAHAKKVDFSNIDRLKSLLYIIINKESENPNTSSIGTEIGSARRTVLEYLDYLAKANVLIMLKDEQSKEGQYTKPQEVFLSNSNLINSLFFRKNDGLFVSKTFFLSQVRHRYSVSVGVDCDFVLNNKYKFIIVSDNNMMKMVNDDKYTFIGIDSVELGIRNKIPLWMFGFMY